MSQNGPININRITEVGVAVKDLEKATHLFVDLLGAEPGPIVDMPMYAMRYRMCRVGKVDFELMAPTEEDGVIAKFIETKGEGLHHVAFAVEDLAEGMRSLKEKGVAFVSDEPLGGNGDSVDYAGRKVSGHTKFTFSVPSSILGILFEFIQYPDGYQTP